MSSADESPIPAFKKRKLQRACDYCRRKKTKCDGPERPNNRCSNCAARHAQCTYLHAPPNKRRYSTSYVENLESRLERMEKFVSTLVPDPEVVKASDAQHPDGYTSQSLGVTSEQSHASTSHAEPPLMSPPFTIAPPSPASADSGTPNEEEEEEEEAELDKELTEPMQKLSMHSQPFRYHGKSSGLVFIRSVLALKNESSGFPPLPKIDGHHPWVKSYVEDDFPVFSESSFPPRDLLGVLVDFYFCHMNCHFPLLHEPTFKNAVKGGRHLRNGGFGATVLLVCAIGSRFTRDTRVLLDGSDHPHSAGWKWFRHVERARRLSFAPATLHDLQVYALMALFLDGSNAPVGTWAVIGAGIRAALEVGVHRKRMYAPTPNVEEELWRRAFWILVSLEWMTGYAYGRPCSIHDEDFDLAFPTECDDEYWLTPEGEPLFRQPPDKPSKVSGFVQLLRLGQILAFANRTIYATNKSRAQLGHADQQWEQRVVAELDSALNKWADSLPSHLRWNPEQEDVLFLSQAAKIAAFYYLHQIAVHRSFMSTSRRESPISPLSTIICMNAARAAIQVVEVLYNRTGNPTHRNMGVIFVSAIVLMRNILGLKRSGGKVNVEKDLALAGKSIEMLRSLRYEMHIADTLAEILSELMSGITESPPPATSANIQERKPVTHKAETGHAPPREYHTPPEGPDPPTHPDVLISPPDLNFAIPGTFLSFATPSRSDNFEEESAMPIDGPVRHNPQKPAPPTVSHANTNDFHSDQDGPSQSQPYETALAGASESEGIEQNPFGMWVGQVFGLEGLSTTSSSFDSAPLHLSAISQAEPANFRSEATSPDHPATIDSASLGFDHDTEMVPDFMLTDDVLATWPSMSPIFGWDDWGGQLANADGGT